MFVVVRTVDDEALELLAEAWTLAGAGPSNVVGLDELDGLPRYGQEMVTTNAKVLWGQNPFSEPSREDFAADLSDVADSLARTASCLLVYPWLTGEERRGMVERMTGSRSSEPSRGIGTTRRGWQGPSTSLLGPGW